MKKDIFTVAPDKGSNNGTLVFVSDANPVKNERSAIFNVSGGGYNRIYYL